MKTEGGSRLPSGCIVMWCRLRRAGYKSRLKWCVLEGYDPVCNTVCDALRWPYDESGFSGMQPYLGGKLDLQLRTSERPMAHKYRKGKMQRKSRRVKQGLKATAVHGTIPAVL